MNYEDIKVKAADKVKDIINCISKNNFDELTSVTLIEKSWCGDNGTQGQGVKNFGEWLTEQLAMWAEDEEKEFVIDGFNEDALELDIDGDMIFVDYNPTSYGEPIDLWFEIKMRIDGDELISEFNVNM